MFSVLRSLESGAECTKDLYSSLFCHTVDGDRRVWRLNRTLRWLLYLVSAGLLVIGALFIMASSYVFSRLPTGIVLIGLGLVIAYFSRERKPITIRQEVTVSGVPTVKEIKCPVCGAILNAEKVQVIDGKPFMTCDYCSNKFEVTEEPKW